MSDMGKTKGIYSNMGIAYTLDIDHQQNLKMACEYITVDDTNPNQMHFEQLI